MANINKSKIIRIYGVTIGEGRLRSYGYGRTKFITDDNKEVDFFVGYVDYFIDDLIS